MTGVENKYTYSFHYFNMKGRGEIIRYVLEYTRTPYNDHRMPPEEWALMKPSTPTGQVPLMEIHSGKDSEFLTQSGAILRHVASVLGVAGRTPMEMARADEAFETIRDILDATGKWYFADTPESKAKAMEEMQKEVIPRDFGFLEKRLTHNGLRNLAGGNSYTYADLALSQFIDFMMTFKGMDKEMDMAPLATMYPNIMNHAKKIAEHPNLAPYLANRPHTDV